MSEGEGRAVPIELIAVIVLSVTAVLTAWSGFESSKWSGEMSIAFSRASTARIEVSRYAAQADAARGFDLNVFGIYIQAVAEEDETLREFVETRFTDHVAVAFEAWRAMQPLENTDALRSPAATMVRPPATEARHRSEVTPRGASDAPQRDHVTRAISPWIGDAAASDRRDR